VDGDIVGGQIRFKRRVDPSEVAVCCCCGDPKSFNFEVGSALLLFTVQCSAYSEELVGPTVVALGVRSRKLSNVGRSSDG
jgi:hypothetical protein